MIKKIGALIVLLFVTNVANAEQQWLDCKVETAGYSASGVISMRLTHVGDQPLFVSKWFKARSDVSEGMLDLAVLALTNNRLITIQAEPFGETFEVIEKMFIN